MTDLDAPRTGEADLDYYERRLTEEHDRAETWLARAASDGLMREAAEAQAARLAAAVKRFLATNYSYVDYYDALGELRAILAERAQAAE